MNRTLLRRSRNDQQLQEKMSNLRHLKNENKKTRTFHLTKIRMAIIRDSRNNKWWCEAWVSEVFCIAGEKAH